MPDLKVRNALIVDFGGQQQFQRVIAEHGAIREFDDRQPIVEHLEGRFLTFPVQDMAKNEDGLASAFGSQVLQSALRRPGAGKGLGVSTRIGSDDGHKKAVKLGRKAGSVI